MPWYSYAWWIICHHVLNVQKSRATIVCHDSVVRYVGNIPQLRKAAPKSISPSGAHTHHAATAADAATATSSGIKAIKELRTPLHADILMCLHAHTCVQEVPRPSIERQPAAPPGGCWYSPGAIRAAVSQRSRCRSTSPRASS